jgi:methyltransferase
MGMSRGAYFILLAVVGLGRLLEMRISARNQRRLAGQGVTRVNEPHFRWMVTLHAGVLVSSAAEVWLLHRPFIPGVALAMGVVFVFANALRWWVIHTLSEHWNVQVMDSARLGVVTSGPYRWVRHPNYAAVFLELLSLPLIYSAWITAVCGTLANLWVLHRRLEVEEAVLESSPTYRSLMSSKPRFLPKLF